MTFELTLAYTLEPNGVAESMGGYINQTQRTQIKDLDFHGVYAVVAKPMSSKTLTATAASKVAFTPKSEVSAFVEDIGKMGWLADKSRPDIALAVNKLQRRTSAPRREDIDALKQLIRYLKGRMSLGILLGKTSDGLVGYVDALYQDFEDGKSTEAYIFFYAGSPISWNSREEGIVARSSTSAEYVALDSAVREAMWLHKIMMQIGIRQEQDLPITIYTDSDNAYTIMKKDNFAKATKWLEARYHFVRHAVRTGIISLSLIASAENIADTLTRLLEREQFERMRDYMMHSVKKH